MIFTFFRRYKFFIVVLAVSSCSVIKGLSYKHFSYTVNDKQKKLVFQLPKGPVEEKYRIGENDAKEQFYYFGDGSVFYVARNITWQTINKFRIDKLAGLNDPKDARVFNGKDNDGLHWKEIQFEGFSIGYGYVAPDRAGLFNEALNSVKIR
jgi:hypothetical protein